MHATICRYEVVGGTPKEWDLAGRLLGSTAGRAPGLVACVVLEVGPGALATVSIFEDEASLKAAQRIVEVSLAECRPRLLPDRPEVTTGEVVYQKGL